MRARVTRLAMSPRTPQLVAQRIMEGGAVAIAAGTVALLASGVPSHLFAAAVVAVAR